MAWVVLTPDRVTGFRRARKGPGPRGAYAAQAARQCAAPCPDFRTWHPTNIGCPTLSAPLFLRLGWEGIKDPPHIQVHEEGVWPASQDCEPAAADGCAMSGFSDMAYHQHRVPHPRRAFVFAPRVGGNQRPTPHPNPGKAKYRACRKGRPVRRRVTESLSPCMALATVPSSG